MLGLSLDFLNLRTASGLVGVEVRSESTQEAGVRLKEAS